MGHARRARWLIAAAVAAVMVTAAPASADILIEFDQLAFGPEGSVQTVATADVAPELVGNTCQVAVIAENQSSVHPGNDLIISTGTSQAVVVGVESEANGGRSETYELVVGPTIVVQLRFGADEISSLGFDLSFDCTAPPAPATTSSTAPPSTTVAPTLDGQAQGNPATTTTAPSANQVQTTPTAPPPTTAAPATSAPPAEQTSDDLPPSPPADPVPATPTYTG